VNSIVWLHYHPEGHVYIRDENDVLVYQASPEQFEREYGAPFPALPGGMTQLELFEGRVYVYDAKHNERDAEHVDSTPYQAVLDALPRLIDAAEKSRRDPNFLPATRF